ncbi:MAG: alginate export family protein [Saprospiraceae bacterium]
MKTPAPDWIKKSWIFFAGFLLIIPTALKAQFSFGGQLVQRAEFRHGYGKLISKTADPAAFISQRIRLQGTYKWEKISLYASIQDIRTWGNAGQAKVSDNLLSVHEAWVLLPLNEYWSVQLGRQELNYDNVRFLGNLDWALQARAHDFARIKYERNHFKLHAGAGFNQSGESLAGNTYTTQDQYKTAQMIRLENKHNAFDYSLLFWNNGRQSIQRDSLNQITDQDTRFTQTMGISNIHYQKGNAHVSGFFYYQTGKDIIARKVNAYDVGLQLSYQFILNEEKNTRLKASAGLEILSGTDQQSTSGKNNSFDPMYGTNHIHNGYMDYFYVGGRHQNSVGLQDAFATITFHPKSTAFVAATFHSFRADADIFNENVQMNKSLGTEIDFTVGYVFNKATSLQAGYSQMFASQSLEFLQSITNPSGTQNWFYLMLIFRPDSEKKFIGVVL